MKKVISSLLVVGILATVAGQTLAQAIQHYNSPLYSPRSYEQDIKKATIGLPPVLDGVGIEQKLDSQIPLETKFKDEDGNEVELRNYFTKGKPVIVALVYYECPMLCNEVLNGLTGSLKALSLNPGKDFEVVAISFNPEETPELAKAKKETYMKKFNRAGTENGWHFLTGNQEAIEQVAQAVGFKYKKTNDPGNQYAHAGGIMITTPEGKLSRYLYGIDYAPKDVKLALIESSASKIGNPADQLLLYCYHYDPATGKYGLAIMRIIRLGGILTIIGMAGLLLILWRAKSGKEKS